MTVFILGAGVMQIPAIRTARELGWYVAAADGNDRAPGAALADDFRQDRKSTRLNSSHLKLSRMPSSA